MGWHRQEDLGDSGRAQWPVCEAQAGADCGRLWTVGRVTVWSVLCRAVSLGVHSACELTQSPRVPVLYHCGSMSTCGGPVCVLREGGGPPVAFLGVPLPRLCLSPPEAFPYQAGRVEVKKVQLGLG